MPDENNVSFNVNINLKKIMLVIGALSAIGGGLYGVAEAAITLDNRYMKVADYKAIEKGKQITNLENKIFALQFKVNKGTATALEKALLERYKAQLLAVRQGS